jgi:uncharacterized protein (TIGR03435 family)
MKLALILICGIASAQTGTVVFEAADVHISPAGASESAAFLPGGRLEVRGASMLHLITIAYNVAADRVSGGPSWIDSDRFDVIAKAAPSASQATKRTMLQALLAGRFGLAIQQEEKPQPVFALTPGKANAAKESSGTGEPGCKRSMEENIIVLICRAMSVEGLAESLPGVAPGYFNYPVVDRSGLKGTYDFTLRWIGRGLLPPGSEGNSLSLFTSIEKQFGVKVEQTTAPMPVLTVVRVNRTPTENPPGVSEKLGSVATEFDVAEIRPSAPNTNEEFNMNNGRIQARGISLKDLITFAYDMDDDGVKGGERWLDSEHFDISAKTAPTASEDTLRIMLRSMLTDRFGLKVHKDTQPVSVYALTAAKPKLKDADPAERTTCQLHNVSGARSFTCTNVTMAQFAERIRRVPAANLDHPVVDMTELKGSYDFTLDWAPPRRTNRPEATAGGESAVPSASDPSRGLTLFEAVERQIGLKLTARKHPMTVVVIDHVERKPTEN